MLICIVHYKSISKPLRFYTRDFTQWGFSLVFEAIIGEGASIRQGAFIRGERFIQTLHPMGCVY